jgi:hypothetical protein
MSTTTSSRDDATDRDSRGAVAPRSTTRRLTTETKHSSKTSELYAYVAATLGVLLAGLLTKAGDGHDDRLQAQETWMIVGILTVGYMISRGLAKSGSRDPYDADASNR